MLEPARRSPFVALLIAVALAAALFVARAAFAAPAAPRGVATGAGVQTVNLGGGGAKLIVQCPAQQVYFRAMVAGEVSDAGTSDLIFDFTGNPDGIPVNFTDSQTQFAVSNTDGGSVRCPYFNNYLP